jgi:hypothetical protein
MTRIPPQLSILDYILAGLGAVLSTYSVGMSVGYPNLAAFLAVLVTLATGLGFLLGKATRGKKIARFDITFWTILAIACWILVFPLNAALPEGGFPFRLMAAASLCWMLIFCSVFSWRDQTLLFLSLPSIALFGLVGTFDTYYYGTALFFAFLISTGVLYARVHQRGMMKRAERAGQVDVDLLWRGPWKWMAGPEWALASGFLVVLVSMVGAPAFKESVRNVAGNIKVSLPTNTTPLSARSGSSQQTGYFVGRGPTRATDDPLFKVKGNGFNYLRRDTALSQYTGRGWSATTVTLHEDNAEINASRSSDDPMLTGPEDDPESWTYLRGDHAAG